MGRSPLNSKGDTSPHTIMNWSALILLCASCSVYGSYGPPSHHGSYDPFHYRPSHHPVGGSHYKPFPSFPVSSGSAFVSIGSPIPSRPGSTSQKYPPAPRPCAPPPHPHRGHRPAGRTSSNPPS